VALRRRVRKNAAAEGDMTIQSPQDIGGGLPMRHIAVPLFAVVLLLGVVASARADVKEYTCDPITFPDGTTGVAVVRVELSDGLAPTVMVSVDYYTENSAQYLGRYDDWSSSSDFPTNEYEAHDYAFKHYTDRH